MGAAVPILLGPPGAGKGTQGRMLSNDMMRGHVSGSHAFGEGYLDQFKLPATAGVCDQCAGTDIKGRADDIAETVRERLNAGHARTARLIAHYRGKRIPERINAVGSIAVVRRDFGAVVAGVSA